MMFGVFGLIIISASAYIGVQFPVLLHNSFCILAKKFYQEMSQKIEKLKQNEFQNIQDNCQLFEQMRQQHQKLLQCAETKCRSEMEDHKSRLDKEYESLMQQFSEDLE